ncbi:hypothetical protein [Pseudomonas putida]|uniref:hypothetical protein n=1 Tax=Pseudomonas putida TaxID=303 RepID=UPI000281E78A|nr:hypothetical protein [Pseudomonas putida]EMR47915.1 hypothetical protein PPUTLS46_008734 [Pseudomonas putida LS46]
MDKVVTEFLRERKDDLPSLYGWTFDHGLASSEFDISFSGETSFDRTLELKTGLRDLVRSTSCEAEHGRVATYFIKVWGGITRFSKVSETLELFSSYKGSTAVPAGFKPSFKLISSWSKWASIVCPDWACIYDARVAYSLNAINYLTGAKHPIFPMPDGRNTRLKMLDITTLLLGERLLPGESSDPKSMRKKHFVSEQDAYPQYLSIVRKVSKDLWGDEKHIHEVEMLLFALADGEIYQEVFNRLAES